MTDIQDTRRSEMMEEVNHTLSDEIDALIDRLNEIVREAPYTPEEKTRFDTLIQDITKAWNRYDDSGDEDDEEEIVNGA